MDRRMDRGMDGSMERKIDDPAQIIIPSCHELIANIDMGNNT